MKPSATRSISVALARSAPTRRALLGAALASRSLRAFAQSAPAGAEAAWPTRTVRLVTLAAPGAGTDAVGRTLADALSRRWEQPVVIDNRPGGEGIVSIETFLAAREGNHTLLFNPTGVWTALHLIHENLSFDPVRELIPLSLVVQDFLALAASPRLGAVTLADIVETARSRPGALTWACAPSVPYLAFTSFLKATGLELTYVPYRNPFASLPDLAEGRVDLAFLPLAPLVGPAQAGKLRLVAVASDERAPLAADVPTATEAGFPALSRVWRSLPVRAQGDARGLAGADCGGRARDHDQCRCRATPPGDGLHSSHATLPQELAAVLERERKRWTEVAQKYGAKPPQ